MTFSFVDVFLIVIVFLLAGALIYTFSYLHRLNKASQHPADKETLPSIPSSSLPVLSSISNRIALLSEALIEQKRVESYRQKMTTMEKQEIAHLLEKEALSRQLERQLDETRQANQMVSGLNQDLEEINASLNEAINRLSALNQISRMLGMEHDKKQLYSMAVSLPVELLKAEIGHLMLPEVEKDNLVVEFSLGLAKAKSGTKHSITAGKGLAGWVATNKKSLLVEDFDKQDRFPLVSTMGYRRRTAISAPIMIKDELIGVISLINRKDGTCFSDEDRTLLATMASETAMAINNALLLERIQKGYFSMVQSLIVAVESKDVYTKGHSERVTQYSLLIGEQMGLDMDQLEIIQQAGVLHDIGKITIELSILNKPTSLDSEEYNKIKDHPLTGFRILEPIDFSEKIKMCVLQHHERIDGMGYPNGFESEDILLEAKILAAADAFDAMTTKRPYRNPLSVQEALREMVRCSGTQFDPEVVEVLTRVVHALTSSGGVALLH
jgi:putative nucleotidyltransferase with HDIG domain